MSYLDTPDTIKCNLTLEGRNLLARIKFGHECIFRVLGWQLGRGGYIHANPVHIEPIIDNADEAVGYIEVLDNSDWEAGDQIVLNGKSFIRGTHWNEGLSIPQTVTNIIDAIHDSKDPRHYRLVNVDVDPGNPNRIRFSSVVTGNILAGKVFNFLPLDINTATDEITMPNHGLVNAMMVQIDTTGTLPSGAAALTNYFVTNATANTFKLSTTLNSPTYVDFTTVGTGVHSIVPTGNFFPLNHAETVGLGDTVNFLVVPMTVPLSTTLLDAAYPVPPLLGTFALPDGRIESPTSTTVSFVMRVPDGPVGMNAYGEIGLWVEVLESSHPMEKGRKVLFAHAHFPILVKTDRSLLTFRAIVHF